MNKNIEQLFRILNFILGKLSRDDEEGSKLQEFANRLYEDIDETLQLYKQEADKKQKTIEVLSNKISEYENNKTIGEKDYEYRMNVMNETGGA